MNHYFKLVLLLASVPSIIFANAMQEHTSLEPVSGNTLTAWEVSSGFPPQVDIAVSTQTGGVWSPPTVISNQAVSINVRKPKTVINANGSMVVVWIGLDPTLFTERLFGSMFVSGSWTAAVPISDSSEIINQDNFSLRLTDNDTVIVVWSSYILPFYVAEVRALYSPVYGTWGSTIVTVGT